MLAFYAVIISVKQNIYYWLLLFCIHLFIIQQSYAQNKPLNNNFSFNDGIYMSYIDFQSNSPSYLLDSIDIQKTTYSNYNFIYAHGINQLLSDSSYLKLPLCKIWGICLNGTPYINYRGFFLENGSNIGSTLPHINPFVKTSTVFTRITVIGAI